MGGLAFTVFVLSLFFLRGECSICDADKNYAKFTASCPSVGSLTVVTLKLKMPKSSDTFPVTQMTWGVKYQEGLTAAEKDVHCDSCASFQAASKTHQCKGITKAERAGRCWYENISLPGWLENSTGAEYLCMSDYSVHEQGSEVTESIIITNEGNENCNDLEIYAHLYDHEEFINGDDAAPSECTEAMKVWCGSGTTSSGTTSGTSSGTSATDTSSGTTSGTLQTLLTWPLVMLPALL